MAIARAETAPAKVNLTLRIIGRRPDGYHDLESLVVFAGVGDTVTLAPARDLALVVRGPTAPASGSIENNLVLKAARALAAQVDGIRLGRFVLAKRLPVAGGLGGGSADAGAALRLLARANRIRLDDPRLLQAARMTGADVPACLDPRPRWMRGIGDILSDPLDLPRIPAILVNPGVTLPTPDVFRRLRLEPRRQGAQVESPAAAWRGGRLELLAALAAATNDLEQPASELEPVIAQVLAELRTLPGCRLARMSGSGATCFGLFNASRGAARAAALLRSRHPSWWVRATVLGG